MKGDKIREPTGRKDKEKELSEWCDLCGLEISISEYVLFSVGWDIDSGARKRDREQRERHCRDYHTKLRELEKQRLYDYSRSFINRNE